jgi:nucleoid-associated protein YgaU
MKDKAKIFNLAMPIDVVVFDLNPSEMKVRYQNSMSTRASSSQGGGGGGVFQTAMKMLMGNVGPVARGPSLTKLSFTALFDNDYAGANDLNPVGDESVRRRCELLGSWTKPGGGSVLGAFASAAISSAAGGKINLTSMPPLLTFQWGEPFDGGFTLNGYLESADVSYLRFSEGGNPTRARVAVSFVEEPRSGINALTNPTSGGIPGRRAHVVAQGENLQTIAVHTYGKPGLWRAIAEANGIDDPMRVHPGATVYLPSPDELELGR